jgi:nitrogen fixation/metabolism regulation signal transduction histidine kinase
MTDQRSKVWVDEFQTRLLRRLCIYLAVYLVGLVNFLFIARLLTEGRGDPLQQFTAVLVDHAPVLLSLLILLPVIAFDALRFSHRLVGPLFRLRSVLHDLAQGQAVRRVKLRQADFLHDMADELNQFLEVVHKQGVPVLKPNDNVDDTQRQSA